jgi:thioredoxin-related protein
MHRIITFVCLFALLLPAANSQTTQPEPAQKILQEAVKKAESSNKTVFLIFHASWCSWCKRLDAALNDPEVNKIMEAHYVITHLDVMESKEKKDLENAGGDKIMKDLGGENSGLPFFAFLDAKGKKIADSNVMPKNQNIGYPGSKEEIAEFEKLLKQTAPSMVDNQRNQVVAYLQKNAPKPR